MKYMFASNFTELYYNIEDMLFEEIVSLLVFIFTKQCKTCGPPNEVSEGTMKRAPYVCVCVRASVRASVRQRKMLLLLYFLADFNSVCFIW